MRNHPAERARQIESVKRAGYDSALGTWPGDPGGPSAEARLTEGPLYQTSLEDCEEYRAEDCAGPLSRGADGVYRCDIHADVFADVHNVDESEGDLPAEVTTPPRPYNPSARVGPDPAVLELEARGHEKTSRFFRKEARRLLDKATGLRRRAALIRRTARSRG